MLPLQGGRERKPGQQDKHARSAIAQLIPPACQAVPRVAATKQGPVTWRCKPCGALAARLRRAAAKHDLDVPSFSEEGCLSRYPLQAATLHK